MTSAQLSLFNRRQADSDPTSMLEPFAPTHEVFSGSSRWKEAAGPESRLDSIFRQRSEQEWERVRARVESLATEVEPGEELQKPVRGSPPADTSDSELLPHTDSDDGDAQADFAPPPPLALRAPDFEVCPLGFVEAGPYGRGVVYSVTPELGQAAVALENGKVTVVALGVLAKLEETAEMAELRGRVESLRKRLGH